MKESQFYYLIALGEFNLCLSSEDRWRMCWGMMAGFSMVLFLTSKVVEYYENKDKK